MRAQFHRIIRDVPRLRRASTSTMTKSTLRTLCVGIFVTLSAQRSSDSTLLDFVLHHSQPQINTDISIQTEWGRERGGTGERQIGGGQLFYTISFNGVVCVDLYDQKRSECKHRRNKKETQRELPLKWIFNRFEITEWIVSLQSVAFGLSISFKWFFYLFAIRRRSQNVTRFSRTHINLVVRCEFITLRFAFRLAPTRGAERQKEKKMTNFVIRKRHNSLIVDKKDKDRTPRIPIAPAPLCVRSLCKWKYAHDGPVCRTL